MLKKTLIALLLAGFAAQFTSGDVLQLKDKAAITGKIIGEKRGDVIVDVGYTWLIIPRSEIIKVTKASDSDSGPHSAAPVATTSVDSRPGSYQTATTPPPVRDVRELVTILGPAVVKVSTPAGLGSGFFIDENGFLITNFHVIEGETHITVDVQSNGQSEPKTYRDVKIIAINKFKDIALLKIEDKDAPKFAHVLIGDSDALATGETVFAIGSPLGLERTVTQGIVSTKTRQMEGELYLQTTAQINPGNSGGPLFNLRGEVVGVTNMKITFGEGLGFAIPISAVKYFLDHRDAFAYSNDNPSNPYRYLEPPSRYKPASDSASK
jgi:serine protease Do